MIKRLRSKSGMTLVEMLAAVMIMALLAAGMSTGMTSGLRVYQEAGFESDSALLASNINTMMTDILRYSTDCKTEEGNILVTNLDYGLRDVYFKNDGGYLYICFWSRNGTTHPSAKALVNTGAYGTLRISNDFQYTYKTDNRGGYYEINYTITNSADTNKTRAVQAVVRQMSR